jgi:hypothetical protein
LSATARFVGALQGRMASRSCLCRMTASGGHREKITSSSGPCQRRCGKRGSAGTADHDFPGRMTATACLYPRDFCPAQTLDSRYKLTSGSTHALSGMRSAITGNSIQSTTAAARFDHSPTLNGCSTSHRGQLDANLAVHRTKQLCRSITSNFCQMKQGSCSTLQRPRPAQRQRFSSGM